jgi:hypothetical protein
MKTLSHQLPFRSALCIEQDHPARSATEQFIRGVYRERFAAEIEVHYPHLLAFEDGESRLRAAVGLRSARQGTLFAERYLQASAEQFLRQMLGLPVNREEIVEFGNFAARGVGDSRALILALIPLLRGAGKRWVLFVATRQLRNAFGRLGLPVRELCPADPAALGAEAAHWGSYYDTGPALCVGDLLQVPEVFPAATEGGTCLEFAQTAAVGVG